MEGRVRYRGVILGRHFEKCWQRCEDDLSWWQAVYEMGKDETSMSLELGIPVAGVKLCTQGAETVSSKPGGSSNSPRPPPWPTRAGCSHKAIMLQWNQTKIENDQMDQM